jgi:hypothetical protein
VASTTAILSEVICAHSVQAAPPALAKSITAAAVSIGAAGSGSTLTLLKGALKIMAWTKMKTAMVIAAALILTAGTTATVLIRHYQSEDRPDWAFTRELSDTENQTYAKTIGLTPAQAAETFFDALRREDAVEAAKFSSPGDIASNFDYSNYMFKHYGGMKVISLGKPFKAFQKSGAPSYHGVYVAYKVQLRDGSVKKWYLPLACNNEPPHWYWDGGM